MLGLLFIYFIGKYFYDLAGSHQKSQWGFAILGVICYYAGTMFGGLILGITLELLEIPIDGYPDMALALLTIPAGLLACWALYKLLENQWSKGAKRETSDVLDQDIMP